MQRGAAAQKAEEEKAKVEVEVQEEVVAAPSGGFGSSAQVARKWYGDCKLRFLLIPAVVIFYLTRRFRIMGICMEMSLQASMKTSCTVNVHFSFGYAFNFDPSKLNYACGILLILDPFRLRC